jgi:hypothetical protein
MRYFVSKLHMHNSVDANVLEWEFQAIPPTANPVAPSNANHTVGQYTIGVEHWDVNLSYASIGAIVFLTQSGRLVSAVGVVRDITGMPLLACKKFVEWLRDS